MNVSGRAYTLIDVKSIDEDERVIEGIASTPKVDRTGDVVEPLGAKFALPMPLLLDHNSREQVGHVEFARPTAKGIPFKARIAKVSDPGEVKDLVDKAWHLVKYKLRAAVSIGFRAMEDGYEVMKNGGIRYTSWEWLELSLVSVPAQDEAVISGAKSFDDNCLSLIKSIDRPLLAATGKEPTASDRPATPGASGTHQQPNPTKGVRIMATKTIAEQISAFEATRQAKAGRMTELMNKAAEEGVTLDQAQTEEYDGLAGEVKSIDEHLVRLNDLEKANRAAAKSVEGVKDAETGSQVRSGVRVEVKGINLPKGTAFTRFAMALARAKGNLMQAQEIAKGWHDSTPEVEIVLKAAVAAGTTTDTTWAKPLVEYQNMASEFAELLKPQTIIGRIPGLRRVPFNIKVPRQTAGSSAQWVGEGAPKPVSALAFDQITLGHTKLAGIVVLTDELVRFSNPSAEALVRQDLIDTIVLTMDKDFVDPTNAGTTDVKPASITNGVTPVMASGTTADHVRADVKALMTKFVTANMSLAGAVWIMSEVQALGLAMMLNPLGQPEFPGLSINGASGGTFFGIPVVLSENVIANPGTGSPVTGDGARIILAKASEIMLADDGEVLLDASREASLQMDSAPTNPPTASTVLTSLWQMNMVGIRAERFINWRKRRSGAVQYIDSAKYA